MTNVRQYTSEWHFLFESQDREKAARFVGMLQAARIPYKFAPCGGGDSIMVSKPYGADAYEVYKASTKPPTVEEWRAKVLAAMFLVDETKKELAAAIDYDYPYTCRKLAGGHLPRRFARMVSERYGLEMPDIGAEDAEKVGTC